MAEFSRIQVTAAEEEDVVIMAGAVERPLAEPSGESPSEEALTAGEGMSSETVTFEQEAVTVPREREGAYRETTLEDLQRTRMSGMQKAIIALAIVAVLAFIIWYVLLR